jgi:RNA-binding protein YhbY
VVEQRIAGIARAIVDGMGRAAIMQSVAKAQADESVKRDNARRAALKAGVEPDRAEIEAMQAVPVVWGDARPAERTIDFYIRRAKDAIGEEGKKLSKQREYVLGMQLARCNEVYQAAFKAGRYGTCVMVIREINEMFGIHEAIKVLLLGAGSESKDGRENLTSDVGKAAALTALIEKATQTDPTLAPIFARFARAQQLPAGALDAPIELPELPELPPRKDSNGNGSNGNGSHS